MDFRNLVYPSFQKTERYPYNLKFQNDLEVAFEKINKLINSMTVKEFDGSFGRQSAPVSSVTSLNFENAVKEVQETLNKVRTQFLTYKSSYYQRSVFDACMTGIGKLVDEFAGYGQIVNAVSYRYVYDDKGAYHPVKPTTQVIGATNFMNRSAKALDNSLSSDQCRTAFGGQGCSSQDQQNSVLRLKSAISAGQPLSPEDLNKLLESIPAPPPAAAVKTIDIDPAPVGTVLELNNFRNPISEVQTN